MRFVILLSLLFPTAAAAAEEKAPPAPYSLPWQLRPAIVPNVVRWDTTFAFYDDVQGREGVTRVSILNGIVRIPKTGGPGVGLGAIVRLPIVWDAPPSGPLRGAAFGNPFLGALYGLKLPAPFKLTGCLGATIPMGMGGGDHPDPVAKNARVKAINARGHIDSALFNVNDLGIVGGADFAWVAYGFTAQIEFTFGQFLRVRGELDQKEPAKTAILAGLHLGYFVLPFLTVSGDLRYQRWTNAPLSVEADPTKDSYDNLTFALGARGHIQLSKTYWLRPGISYGRALDKPLSASTPNYHYLQIDVPFYF